MSGFDCILPIQEVTDQIYMMINNAYYNGGLMPENASRHNTTTDHSVPLASTTGVRLTNDKVVSLEDVVVMLSKVINDVGTVPEEELAPEEMSGLVGMMKPDHRGVKPERQGMKPDRDRERRRGREMLQAWSREGTFLGVTSRESDLVGSVSLGSGDPCGVAMGDGMSDMREKGLAAKDVDHLHEILYTGQVNSERFGLPTTPIPPVHSRWLVYLIGGMEKDKAEALFEALCVLSEWRGDKVSQSDHTEKFIKNISLLLEYSGEGEEAEFDAILSMWTYMCNERKRYVFGKYLSYEVTPAWRPEEEVDEDRLVKDSEIPEQLKERIVRRASLDVYQDVKNILNGVRFCDYFQRDSDGGFGPRALQFGGAPRYHSGVRTGVEFFHPKANLETETGEELNPSPEYNDLSRQGNFWNIAQRVNYSEHPFSGRKIPICPVAYVVDWLVAWADSQAYWIGIEMGLSERRGGFWPTRATSAFWGSDSSVIEIEWILMDWGKKFSFIGRDLWEANDVAYMKIYIEAYQLALLDTSLSFSKRNRFHFQSPESSRVWTLEWRNKPAHIEEDTIEGVECTSVSCLCDRRRELIINAEMVEADLMAWEVDQEAAEEASDRYFDLLGKEEHLDLPDGTEPTESGTLRTSVGYNLGTMVEHLPDWKSATDEVVRVAENTRPSDSVAVPSALSEKVGAFVKDAKKLLVGIPSEMDTIDDSADERDRAFNESLDEESRAVDQLWACLEGVPCDDDLPRIAEEMKEARVLKAKLSIVGAEEFVNEVLQKYGV